MKGTARNAGKPIIGLAGGIGAGKSTVASALQKLGAGVISSDRLNHEELDCPDVRDELRSWWGETVITPDGHINRDVIRNIVIRDAEARRRLEQLVHPRIARRREAMVAQYQADPRVRAIVLDSPLLFEAGLADQCSDVIFVDTELEVRAARVASDRGWQPEELLRLEKAQKPLDFKRDSADYRVVNNSDVGDLHRQVEEIFSRILSGA
jgi:dephospho-CoA kinase